MVCLKPNHFDTVAKAWIAKTSWRRLLASLLGGSLGLLGAPHAEGAIARDCHKIRNKKKRRRCLQKAQMDNVSFPVRAASYYPWFPNAWKQRTYYPYTNYQPSLGYYDGGDVATIRQHIQAMQYGGISVGIASWWGVGHHTDQRIPALLSAAFGTGFQWTLYYEQEGTTTPSVDQLRADLTYIRDHYASHPSYARIAGKFVVFVYNANDYDCTVADRWQQANSVGAYLVLKVFHGYRICANQPQSWHQYGPADAADQQAGYSYSISPGFWQKGEEVRLARDLPRWQQNVRDMVASGTPWQLVTTFNEWGEGTAVESAEEWSSPSGYGVYLDALHRNGQP